MTSNRYLGEEWQGVRQNGRIGEYVPAIPHLDSGRPCLKAESESKAEGSDPRTKEPRTCYGRPAVQPIERKHDRNSPIP